MATIDRRLMSDSGHWLPGARRETVFGSANPGPPCGGQLLFPNFAYPIPAPSAAWYRQSLRSATFSTRAPSSLHAPRANARLEAGWLAIHTSIKESRRLHLVHERP